jgi:DNA-binding protein
MITAQKFQRGTLAPYFFQCGGRMSRKTNVVPKAPAARILLKMGAKRVSAEGVSAFADVITNIAEEIGEKAVQIAKHSGRKTVQEGDIRLAIR